MKHYVSSKPISDAGEPSRKREHSGSVADRFHHKMWAKFQHFMACCSASVHSLSSFCSRSSRGHCYCSPTDGSRPSSPCWAYQRLPRKNWPASPTLLTWPTSPALLAHPASHTLSAMGDHPGRFNSPACPACPASFDCMACASPFHSIWLTDCQSMSQMVL